MNICDKYALAKEGTLTLIWLQVLKGYSQIVLGTQGSY
jgi:hypothetical protein